MGVVALLYERKGVDVVVVVVVVAMAEARDLEGAAAVTVEAAAGLPSLPSLP